MSKAITKMATQTGEFSAERTIRKFRIVAREAARGVERWVGDDNINAI